ncbi:hypothetical protein [Lacticaseibacillus yichunensis]|uniref:Uncharacterized protein n=1 Tax=Lacticaseibacillus yichunensis TaxID=2486015 RepID=A0ABW4CR59_9LACO|nr:hypothetical protein [Lacticaseibacillus yichunensis]
MAEEQTVSRMQKAEGADTIMDQGYITEREEPAMMDKKWCKLFEAQINDELRLRTLAQRVVLKKFNYYMGEGRIIYDPSRLTEGDAKQTCQIALGYHK